MRYIERAGRRVSPEMRQHLDTVLGWIGYGLGYAEANRFAADDGADQVDTHIPRAQTRRDGQVGRSPISEAPSAPAGPSTSSGKDQTWQAISHNGSKPSGRLEGRALRDRVADQLEEIGAGVETASAWLAEAVGPMKVTRRVRDGFRARVESGVESVSDRATAVTRSVEQPAATWRESSVRDLRIGRMWWPDAATEGNLEVENEAEAGMQDDMLDAPTAPRPVIAPPTEQPMPMTPVGVSDEDRPVKILARVSDAESKPTSKPLRYIKMHLPEPSISEPEPARFEPELPVSKGVETSVETPSVPSESSSVGSWNLLEDPEPATIADDSLKLPERIPTGLGQGHGGSFSLWSLLPTFLRRRESQATTLFGSSLAGAVSENELSKEYSVERPMALERLSRLLQADKEREAGDVSDRPTRDHTDIH